MLAQADTKEEVLEAIRGDVYFKNEVWDESKVSGVCCLVVWTEESVDSTVGW